MAGGVNRAMQSFGLISNSAPVSRFIYNTISSEIIYEFRCSYILFSLQLELLSLALSFIYEMCMQSVSFDMLK